mgnify:CR=1 FL=1
MLIAPIVLGKSGLRNRLERQESFFGLTRSTAKRDLVVVGVPWDATSSYRRGAVAGPDAIRRATSGRLYNRFTEQGLDLAALWKVCDHGNVKETSDISKLKKSLASAISLHDHRDHSTLFLGGDHFISYPCFSLMAQKCKSRFSLLYFDAHPDLYESYEGSRYSHATTVSRILEDKNLSSGTVCYVGIRASTSEQNERIRTLGLTAHTTKDVYRRGCDAIASSIRSVLLNQPVYLSIDLDCLDPAFAPGVGNPQPGGLSTTQILEILHGIEGLEIVVADIVEYSPRFDSNARTTAFTSAILIKEIMGIIAKSFTSQRVRPA